jgi:hypothetical protein
VVQRPDIGKVPERSATPGPSRLSCPVCWAEASALAAERHAAVEAVWVQEQRDKDQEIAELVDDLDKASAEKDAAAAGHAEGFTASRRTGARWSASLL